MALLKPARLRNPRTSRDGTHTAINVHVLRAVLRAVDQRAQASGCSRRHALHQALNKHYRLGLPAAKSAAAPPDRRSPKVTGPGGETVAVSVYMHRDMLAALDGRATDNGRSRRSQLHLDLCAALGLDPETARAK